MTPRGRRTIVLRSGKPGLSDARGEQHQLMRGRATHGSSPGGTRTVARSCSRTLDMYIGVRYICTRYISHARGRRDRQTMADRMKDPQDLLPLPAAHLHILVALVDNEKHGYAVMREVERMTGGEITMGPGTLYGAIKRMLGTGLVVETDERPDPAVDDERRRYYQTTGFGARVLSAEMARLERLVQTARRKQVSRWPVPGLGET